MIKTFAGYSCNGGMDAAVRDAERDLAKFRDAGIEGLHYEVKSTTATMLVNDGQAEYWFTLTVEIS